MPKISPQKSGIMYLSLTLPDIEISIFTLGRMLKFQELTCRIRVFNLWLACEYSRLPSLLAAKAVSRERRLRFNDGNSILMTLNQSRICSGALIAQLSNYILAAIVYE